MLRLTCRNIPEMDMGPLAKTSLADLWLTDAGFYEDVAMA